MGDIITMPSNTQSAKSVIEDLYNQRDSVRNVVVLWEDKDENICRDHSLTDWRMAAILSTYFSSYICSYIPSLDME